MPTFGRDFSIVLLKHIFKRNYMLFAVFAMESQAILPVAQAD